jgi:hypothetical protein
MMSRSFQSRRVTSVFITASILLFLASLTQNGFYIDRKDNPEAWSPCFGLLLIGWIAVPLGIPAWLANPAIFLAWICGLFGWKQSAVVSCAFALVFSLSFIFCERILTDEGGGESGITGYGIGYWLWNASIAVALLGSTITLFVPTTSDKSAAITQASGKPV